MNTDYGHVLPTKWNEDDKKCFCDMVYSGNVIVLVWYVEKDGENIKYVRHH